jgi:small subunit ribosomal protein S15
MNSMLAKEQKNEIISRFQRQEGDVGSPEVQIALLSARIRGLQGHFTVNKKDRHSRRGLLKMVSTRKKLLTYLLRKDKAKHQQLISDLDIRG